MYFIFNDVDSRELGIRVKDVPYDIMAQRRINELVLDRYNGTIYTDKKTYDSYTLDLECLLVDNFNMDNIRVIKKLFLQGRGELKLSHKPGVIYKAVLTSTLNFSELYTNIGSFLLSFKIEPLALLESGKKYINVTGNKITLKNEGNYPSCPLIKVDGVTSSISISINGKSMKFINAKQPFIVDVELEDVLGANGENLNSYMTIESDFIQLDIGDNDITISGATNVSIMPRWVEL